MKFFAAYCFMCFFSTALRQGGWYCSYPLLSLNDHSVTHFALSRTRPGTPTHSDTNMLIFVPLLNKKGSYRKCRWEETKELWEWSHQHHRILWLIDVQQHCHRKCLDLFSANRLSFAARYRHVPLYPSKLLSFTLDLFLLGHLVSADPGLRSNILTSTIMLV